ncbi:hypothetical protein MLP_40740 [Microlunatus phosphovorus NM-1]|uniref:Alpha/beta hydrolase n=1 Tax=Microlunatus phosphovorus (strain ATCC 700054 / DSM 10555 / JCM 9379 / NBRC 101784 / NCIMB 13414 / VKM Ac-1990 / NM-1) TaxID=1032480 RepID=F5XR66_MICPN|nr:alpha/beta hydrolase [Microlunatus phosphovorus]BAK37088.1 hypothetical protein MLP_40740 [Microlunatus phosphovorus NM-1]
MPSIEHVTFKNRDMFWEIAADIYLPPHFDPDRQFPTIVVAHPIGSCKEQTSGEIFSARLAEQGFVAVAFDASFQGASGGDPRAIEDPTLRIEDFRHVADFLGATDYYKTDRGAKPHGRNQTLRSHLGSGYGWDAFHLAEELLTQPLLVIVGSVPGGFGAYRDGHEIVRRARSQQKELVVIDGWSHYDLYDKPEPVAQAMAKLVPFFTKNL